MVAGGTCAFNPSRWPPSVDIFSLGEGEDVSVELLELYRTAKKRGLDQGGISPGRGSRSPGLYMPSLYDVSYHEDGTVAAITPRTAPRRWSPSGSSRTSTSPISR